jgi:hypothetical protein
MSIASSVWDNPLREGARAFAEVVMKVRDWLHHGRDFSGLW